MYRKRTHWVPCYLKDTFFAGMTSSQRSESINAFFDTYVNSQTLLPDFVEQYHKAILSRRSQELSKDFATLNTKPVMHLNHPIEIQAGELYTRAIFERFQDELKGSVSLFHNEIGNEESISKYIVGSISTERSVWEHVVYNQNEQRITCTCAMFETNGILCRHAIHIMISNQLVRIPQEYIMHRWTMNAMHRNIGVSHVLLEKNFNSNREQWTTLRSWALRAKFNNVMEWAPESPMVFDEIDTFFSNLMEKHEKDISAKQIKGIEATSRVESSTPPSHTIEKLPQITVRDPLESTKHKGRPRTISRLKSGLEQAQGKKEIKKRTCGRCGQKGHYKSSCTNSLVANPSNN
ncbi:protein FAR1-RELATED SEQUENCE 5-like isoform X2 [Asparagus officinalis]|uniref:protein FAR1-RELATED SEQUENCE 5-like isoform X1 n=1 Tax=Asparagus officinalis TaxID=4686 RepID=UPI00098DF988|nr:protein FAR1-RELATED SEQUENCE 5-like isoform X1 [Asparagus officinalis]XP_020245062.1 protein FAR1-RELATED SEQUENCE 5-like isoform X2 [Asparagus officinalis]XP_020245069.1 protein FAR1-RELATED SEQUENCE 5-like isoform X2 [Asparagus officinalis]